MKKLISLSLALALFISLAAPTFAIESSFNVTTSENVTYDRPTINMNDPVAWEQMKQRDIEEYETRLNSIDKNLSEDVAAFMSTNNIQPQSMDNNDFLTQFLSAYPEYNNLNIDQLTSDVEILRWNPAVELVRAFFSSNGYDLALDLFNHSLTEDPENAICTLTGNTDGMYGHIRTLLTNDPFLDKLIAFSEESSIRETIRDTSHIFESGDLYWAIHGFTWTRTRQAIGCADFIIYDKYDFNKWQDIPGIVAGISGTNEFDIFIYGKLLNGVIK